jgi:hypothetical protein
MITTIITAVLLGLLMGPLGDMYNSNIQGTQTVVQTADTRNALRTIAEDVEWASAFYGNDLTDPIGPTPPTTSQKWTGSTYSYAGSGSTNRILILGRYATTGLETTDNVDNPTRALLLGSDCMTPITNTIIFFVKDKNLYKRTVPNTSAAKCAAQASLTIAQRQSCPVSYTNAVCTSKDALLLRAVENFSIQYYSDPKDSSTLIPYGGDISLATGAKVIVETNVGTGDRTATSGTGYRTTAKSELLMTRRNGDGL